LRILVTGGAGFIGSNLTRVALRDPLVKDVAVIDDMSTGMRSNLDGLDVEILEASIIDESALDAVMSGRDAVVHLAALPSVPRSVQDPISSHNVNVNGTLTVLEAARRHDVGMVVLASSSSVYGLNPLLPKAELTWTRPLSPYAASKLAAETYALAYQSSYGLSTLAFRFFNVFGPGQRHDHPYAAVIPRFVSAALHGEPVLIHGDGSQSRDFTCVDTVCAVILDALRRSVSHPHPVNLAFATRATLLEVLDEIEEVTGRPVERRHGPPRTGDIMHSMADSRLLHQLFPDVKATTRIEGLRATVDWFSRQPGVRPAAIQ
jgi:UDP-glucose 4-epimerase